MCFGCDGVRCVHIVFLVHIMRTNIEIDDELMDIAMRAGPYRTKKDAVEAGLKLLAQQVSYREVLKWHGKLHWDGDAWDDSVPTVVAGKLVKVGAVKGRPGKDATRSARAGRSAAAASRVLKSS